MRYLFVIFDLLIVVVVLCAPSLNLKFCTNYGLNIRPVNVFETDLVILVEKFGSISAVNVSINARVWQKKLDLKSVPSIGFDKHSRKDENFAVYLGGVIKLLGQSGTIQWKNMIGGTIGHSPLYISSQSIVISGSDHGTIYALHSNTGDILWSTQLNGGKTGYLALDAIENVLFVGTSISSKRVAPTSWKSPGANDGFLYAINVQSGTVLWKFAPTHAASFMYKAAVEVSQHMVCSTWFTPAQYALSCLDINTGSVHWEFVSFVRFTTSPVVGLGCLFVGSGDGFLYAVNSTTGAKLWDHRFLSTLSSTPVISRDGASLVVGSSDGYVTWLDITSGVELASFKTTGPVTDMVLHKDLVMFGSSDGCLYVINADLEQNVDDNSSIDDVNDDGQVDDSSTIEDDGTDGDNDDIVVSNAPTLSPTMQPALVVATSEAPTASTKTRWPTSTPSFATVLVDAPLAPSTTFKPFAVNTVTPTLLPELLPSQISSTPSPSHAHDRDSSSSKPTVANSPRSCDSVMPSVSTEPSPVVVRSLKPSASSWSVAPTTMPLTKPLLSHVPSQCPTASGVSLRPTEAVTVISNGTIANHPNDDISISESSAPSPSPTPATDEQVNTATPTTQQSIVPLASPTATDTSSAPSTLLHSIHSSNGNSSTSNHTAVTVNQANVHTTSTSHTAAVAGGAAGGVLMLLAAVYFTATRTSLLQKGSAMASKGGEVIRKLLPSSVVASLWSSDRDSGGRDLESFNRIFPMSPQSISSLSHNNSRIPNPSLINLQPLSSVKHGIGSDAPPPSSVREPLQGFFYPLECNENNDFIESTHDI